MLVSNNSSGIFPNYKYILSTTMSNKLIIIGPNELIIIGPYEQM